MKKLICLLLCLILIISCVPAMAASLKPENVYGTWVLYKIVDGEETYDADFLKQNNQSMTMQIHADGTGKLSGYNPDAGSYSSSMNWEIKSGKFHVTEENGAESFLKKSGSSLYFAAGDDASSTKIYFRKTKETSGKTTTKAITSIGTYKLNNSKKTASFTMIANRSKTSLTIPDTIKANGKTYKVTEIAAKSCANMKKLTTLTIGKNVKTIGATAFVGDTKLKKITFKGGLLTKVGSKAFASVAKSGTVICPKTKLKKYTGLLKKGGLPESVKIKGK
jgi:hypothetical protein